MKKIKKINLQIDKEVISSLSNDEMNSVKGGALPETWQPDCPDKDERGSKVVTGAKPITCDCPISPYQTIEVECYSLVGSPCGNLTEDRLLCNV